MIFVSADLRAVCFWNRTEILDDRHETVGAVLWLAVGQGIRTSDAGLDWSTELIRRATHSDLARVTDR